LVMVVDQRVRAGLCGHGVGSLAAVGGAHVVVGSFGYLASGPMIGLVLLGFGSGDAKEVEMLVLGHGLDIL
jgi:hypothetical protein